MQLEFSSTSRNISVRETSKSCSVLILLLDLGKLVDFFGNLKVKLQIYNLWRINTGAAVLVTLVKVTALIFNVT